MLRERKVAVRGRRSDDPRDDWRLSHCAAVERAGRRSFSNLDPVRRVLPADKVVAEANGDEDGGACDRGEYDGGAHGVDRWAAEDADESGPTRRRMHGPRGLHGDDAASHAARRREGQGRVAERRVPAFPEQLRRRWG